MPNAAPADAMAGKTGRFDAKLENYIFRPTSRAVSEVASPARSRSFPMPSNVLQPAIEPNTPISINTAKIDFNMMFPIQVSFEPERTACAAQWGSLP
jgi:hypothetical protein